MMNVRTASQILAITLLASVTWATGLSGLQGNPAMSLLVHDKDSQTAQEATHMLREGRGGMLDEDNGEEIVFSADDGLWVQFANGTGRRQLIALTPNFHSIFIYPAWSPDGTRLAFAAKRAADPRIVDLAVANADGSGAEVILTLAEAYYWSYIQSISWHSNNADILFVYQWDDINVNTMAAVCGIHSDGSGFVVLGGSDRRFCATEPGSGSTRYAYVSTGSPFDQNTRLHVINYNGTNDQTWATATGVINGMGDLCWRNANSIYVVIRNWNGREVVCRVNHSPFSATPVIYADPGAVLGTITLSPNRLSMYNTEQTSTGCTMYQSTLNGEGGVVSFVARGLGYFPNWRQVMPPPQPTLTFPNGGETFNRSQMMNITWTNNGPAPDHWELEWSANSGATWTVIGGAVLPGDYTSYRFFVSNLPVTDHARIRVVGLLDGVRYVDASDADFHVVNTPSAADDETLLPVTTVLVRNYPNPFNNATTVEYAVPQTGEVTVQVWNTAGQFVTELLNGVRPAGRHELAWDASALATGTYFLTVRVGEHVARHKVLLIK